MNFKRIKNTVNYFRLAGKKRPEVYVVFKRILERKNIVDIRSLNLAADTEITI